MAKKVKVKKTLVEQILSKAGIPHQGIQINALEGELPQGYERDQILTFFAIIYTYPPIGSSKYQARFPRRRRRQ